MIDQGLLFWLSCAISFVDTLKIELSHFHISSSLHLADLFMKAMTRHHHNFLISKLMLFDNQQQFEGEGQQNPNSDTPATHSISTNLNQRKDIIQYYRVDWSTGLNQG